MKNMRTLLILILLIALVIISVSADTINNTDSTTVPTGNATNVTSTTITTPETTLPIIPVNTTPVLFPINTTVLPTSTGTSPIPSDTSDNQPPEGNITAVSSPLGANILIDGVFYGYTPGKITGIAAGNHIVRLTLSGYYDYEGNIYIIPGQVTSVYGTLQPINGYPATSTPTPEITISPTPASVQATPSSQPGPLDNPTVLAAIIGTFSAVIGAIVAILTHFSNSKKNDAWEKHNSNHTILGIWQIRLLPLRVVLQE